MRWIYIAEQRGHYRAGLQVATRLRPMRELRQQQTDAEEMLWEELRGRKFLRDNELHIVRFRNEMILKNLDQTLLQLEDICRRIDGERR